MRWRSRRQSNNIEDRRGQPVQRAAAGGAALRLLPMLMRSKNGRRILIVGAVVLLGAQFFGINLLPMLGLGGQPASNPGRTGQALSNEQQQLGQFVSVVLADTEDTWGELFKTMGKSYQQPKLVLFTGKVNSACGSASAAMGPFYCPGDQKVYIDLSFYHDLRQRHGAPGDFAQAYVIAHEVGHHVQTLLGISSKVHAMRGKVSKTEGNRLSVKQELQADCFAGVWGFHADQHRQMLETGDLEEALTAAAAIGDDRLQHQAQGTVTPDSFTHGSSAQRVEWFKRGFQSGNPSVCDTFTETGL